VNQIAQLQEEVSLPSNEALLESNDVSTSQNKALLAGNVAYSQVTETAIKNSRTMEVPLKRVNSLKKHPYNYHMKERPSSGFTWNQSLRKIILSHNQMICLVQHVLDPTDVPLFISSVETIKLSNGQFPNMVPLLVRKEIFDKFFLPKNATTRVDIVDMYNSDHVKISQVEYKGMVKATVSCTKSIYFQTLGKTPIWAIAHCLKRIVSQRKCYTLENSSFEELGLAADNAFLVEGILNVNNPLEEFNEWNEHIHCCPKMNYVKGGKGDSKVVDFCSPVYSIHWKIFFS